MAYKIFQPFIIKDLKQQGMSASAALKAYNDEDILAKNSLNNVVKSRPVVINRAPSLHKHSIQAFNTVLTDGSDIKLNPLVVKGFNADFDGDTMSVNIPIGNDAIEEANRMLPSKNIFKHGDLSVVPDLGQDYQLGLYQASLLGKNTGKSFKTISDAKSARLEMTDVFKLGRQNMTLGQYYINKDLPEPLKDYSRVMDANTVGDVLSRVGKNYRDKFSVIINAWKDLSVQYGHTIGNTVSITDFAINRDYRDRLYKDRLPKIQAMSGDKRIEALLKLTTDTEKAQDKSLSSSNNLYRMYESGSFSKKDSIRQVLSMPGVLQDVSGKALPIPVLKSYGEGIDTPSYFNSMYAVRKGTIDRAVNTQDSGALNKTLLSVNRNLLITEEDCKTLRDIEMTVDSKDAMDRVLGQSVSGVARRNDLINSNMILKLKTAGIRSIKVRSPLTCESVEGICSFCYGLMPNGSLPSVGVSIGILESQALTERSTQLVMKTFHSGGSASAGGGLTDKFPRLEQLLKVPEKLLGKATLSDVKGKVKWIEKNPIGGYDLRIEGYGTQNDKTFTVPSGRIPVVKIGDLVNVGDKVSDGTIKPQELSDLKSHLEAQQYIVDELNGPVFDSKFFKKTFETIVRGISDNAYITEAPTGSGFLRGDKTSITRIERLNKEREMTGLDLIGYRPYFKSVDTLNSDSEDWLTKFTTNRIKAALVEGASAGQVTDIHGKDPIPAYIYGEEFARNEGEYY
jgi:DNA-directed RNA polymerase subunit beta'